MLNWIVENKGIGSILFKFWYDMVYLLSFLIIENNLIMLIIVFFELLVLGRRYNYVLFVKLLLNIIGINYFVLKVNEGGFFVEKGVKINNLVWMCVKILFVFFLDLVVVDIFFVFEEKCCFLIVYWFVVNIGSWMCKSVFWLDRVIILLLRGVIDGKDVCVLVFESVIVKLDE